MALCQWFAAGKVGIRLAMTFGWDVLLTDGEFFMKKVSVLKFLLLCLIGASQLAFAGTKECENLAIKTAIHAMAKFAADDCPLRFVQPGKANPNVINIGFQCDHVGNYLYQVTTVPQPGGQCVITNVTQKTF